MLQWFLGYLQVKDFNAHYNDLRKKGKVVIGKYKGGLFHPGVIVLLGVDQDYRITNAKRLIGFSVFARVKPLQGLENTYLEELERKDLKAFDRFTRKALENAVKEIKVFREKTLIQGGENSV